MAETKRDGQCLERFAKKFLHSCKEKLNICNYLWLWYCPTSSCRCSKWLLHSCIQWALFLNNHISAWNGVLTLFTIVQHPKKSPRGMNYLRQCIRTRFKYYHQHPDGHRLLNQFQVFRYLRSTQDPPDVLMRALCNLSDARSQAGDFVGS